MSTQDRAPALPLYAKDWLADPKVRALSWASKGRYIDLLLSMWEHERAGCRIPQATAVRLWGRPFVELICAGPSPLVIVYDDEDGVMWLFHDRLFQEAQKCASRQKAAQKAVEARWEKERLRRLESDTDVLRT